MNNLFEIRTMRADDLKKVKDFTDRAIGQNYYTFEELEVIFEKSTFENQVCSLVLADANGQIYGVRITYPPTRWQKGKGKGLNPLLWKVPFEEAAYFQSLFIAPELTSQGWGKKMSLEAIKILRDLKTQAIVTHSWKESPQDSSGKYLRSLGFTIVATHPLYWHEVDYVCTRCGKPCMCTADEMILYL